MAIIELKNVTGLLEATMSDYLDSAVITAKTPRKELVKLLQATDESLDMLLDNMEGKVASSNALQHSLDVYKLEYEKLKQKASAADNLEGKVSALTEENSKLSQELQDTSEKLAKAQATVKSLEHDLGEAVLEKNNAEEREAEAKFELSSCKTQLELTSSELELLKASYSQVLDQLNTSRCENIDLRASLEGYKSRGFFARIFNL